MSDSSLKNKRILIICESPNKIKTISNILKDAGYSKAVVMASVGHISNIKDARNSYKNTGIYPAQEFKMNLVISDDKKDVVKKLKEQANIAERIYLMTDPDREGAQIAWSLIKFLNLSPDKYVRAITHEITPKAVIYALENPIPLETNLIEAAQTRMILDKMVGYALSPVAKVCLGARSVGRCQSAGLKLVVDKEKEIQSFVPETYYDLYLNFTKNTTNFKAKYVGTDSTPVDRITSKNTIIRIKEDCTGDFVIKNISKKEKHEVPKPPFCTATYQQEANTKLHLSIKDAMSCAQKLFEGINVEGKHIGLITYHRTDAVNIAEEFIPELRTFVTDNLKLTYTAPRTGKKRDSDQEGHECLRCVDPNLTPEIVAQYLPNDLLIKVYKLIWQRTIAAVLSDAIISETTYNIYNNQHKFTLTSNEIIDAGYRQIYSTLDDTEIMTDAFVKETFVEGEILQNCELVDLKKQTQPPARYKEASFVKELQRQEIGRPSTYGSIVETILSSTRGYCNLVVKQIIPTERGIQLSDFLTRAFSSVISIDYTRKLEKSLDLIAQGKLSKLEFLNNFYTDLELAIKTNTENIPAPTNIKACPKCGAPMVVRRSRFGKLFYGCSNYPQCNGIIGMD